MGSFVGAADGAADGAAVGAAVGGAAVTHPGLSLRKNGREEDDAPPWQYLTVAARHAC